MEDAYSFLQSVAAFARAQNPVPVNKLARIDYDFDLANFPGILPRVIFDGEKTVSTHRYRVLSPYIPEPGDRVLMTPVGNTYVIAGSVDSKENLWTGRGDFDTIGGATETTTSTSYTNLSTYGPEVTVYTGNKALVAIMCNIRVIDGGNAIMGYEVSGATSISPSDENAVTYDDIGTNNAGLVLSRVDIVHLNPGPNTFTMKYRTSSSATSAGFSRRNIVVIPI